MDEYQNPWLQLELWEEIFLEFPLTCWRPFFWFGFWGFFNLFLISPQSSFYGVQRMGRYYPLSYLKVNDCIYCPCGLKLSCLVLLFQISQILVWRLSFVTRCSSNIYLTMCFSLAKVAANMHGWYKRTQLPWLEKEIALHQLKIYWRASSLLV